MLKYHSIGETNTAGFVAIDNTNKLIIVAIQGTSIASNPIDVLTDIDLIRDKTDLCGTANTNDGCEIHSGFWQATNDVFSLVEINVNLALALHPDYKIVTTSHSLGGAVAALLGAKLRNCGKLIDVVSSYLAHTVPSNY